VLGDLSAADERGVKIMARHRVSLLRDAKQRPSRAFGNAWSCVPWAPIAAGARRAGVQAVWIHSHSSSHSLAIKSSVACHQP
jgi:hypothetical protein